MFYTTSVKDKLLEEPVNTDAYLQLVEDTPVSPLEHLLRHIIVLGQHFNAFLKHKQIDLPKSNDPFGHNFRHVYKPENRKQYFLYQPIHSTVKSPDKHAKKNSRRC